MSELFFTGLLNRFSFDVADRERSTLEKKYETSERFAREFNIPRDLMLELERYATKEGITARKGDLERSREQIATRIKAGIARNVWGDDGYYRILLQRDPAYVKAQLELGTAGPIGAQ